MLIFFILFICFLLVYGLVSYIKSTNNQIQSAKQAAISEIETRKKELITQADERIRKAEEEKVRKQHSFEARLSALPVVPLLFCDVPPLKPQKKLINIDELKYTTLTARSNRDILRNYISIDIETTGLDSDAHIIEVSAIRFENFTPKEIFTTLVCPKIKIPFSATHINGITDEMVKDAPSIELVIPLLHEFIGQSNLVGHNLPFDLKFLIRDGLSLLRKQRLYDTLQISRRHLKQYSEPRYSHNDNFDDIPIFDVVNYKLPTICEYYKIPYFKAHRSTADALVTGEVFSRLVWSIVQ